MDVGQLLTGMVAALPALAAVVSVAVWVGRLAQRSDTMAGRLDRVEERVDRGEVACAATHGKDREVDGDARTRLARLEVEVDALKAGQGKVVAQLDRLEVLVVRIDERLAARDRASMG